MLKDRKIGAHSDVYGGIPAVLEKSRMLEELEADPEMKGTINILNKRERSAAPLLKLEP